MKVYSRKGYWWVDVRSDGKRIRRSLKIKVRGKPPKPGAVFGDLKHQASKIEAAAAAYKYYNSDIYRDEGFDFEAAEIWRTTWGEGKSC